MAQPVGRAVATGRRAKRKAAYACRRSTRSGDGRGFDSRRLHFSAPSREFVCFRRERLRGLVIEHLAQRLGELVDVPTTRFYAGLGEMSLSRSRAISSLPTAKW
jgi:hypothetical protein